MREINQTEIAAVSGAGLSTFINDVNEALSQVSTLLDSTVKTLTETTVLEEEIGLSYKAFGLSIAKGFLTSFSSFLTKLAS
ncbi:MAG: hypothetical protein E6868_13840 [Pantoea sp.]|uniref:hypothetical protein n=1 Tax=Pantoea TaxID=53335 RepID=UPI0028B0B4B4|nr:MULTISPECIES: hypothetical protein [Pantoea]MDU1574321.1 hypothetical protein [Pantoea sp.]